jgi:hypothetical protein
MMRLKHECNRKPGWPGHCVARLPDKKVMVAFRALHRLLYMQRSVQRTPRRWLGVGSAHDRMRAPRAKERDHGRERRHA